jgi:hypothetical protein
MDFTTGLELALAVLLFGSGYLLGKVGLTGIKSEITAIETDLANVKKLFVTTPVVVTPTVSPVVSSPSA